MGCWWPEKHRFTRASRDRAVLETSFVRLEFGRDDFNGMAVPFLGHANANPKLLEQSAAQRDAARTFVSQMLASLDMKLVIDTMKAAVAKLLGLGRKKPK